MERHGRTLHKSPSPHPCNNIAPDIATADAGGDDIYVQMVYYLSANGIMKILG